MNQKLCNLCPRSCNVDRAVKRGVCGAGEKLTAARVAPHYWEEPVISGKNGSGTIFFSGCPLKCVFCQNKKISREGFGTEISVGRLREIFRELEKSGVHNINLVTPTHFAPLIAKALSPRPSVPVVYNCGGYESVETLRLLEGKIDIYLPDMKYSDPGAAQRYSAAADYPEIARKAVLEMFRQVGEPRYDSEGMMTGGVIIRHLVLPSNLKNTYGVIDWVKNSFKKGSVLFSLMSQYTPYENLEKYPEINRRLTAREYEKAENYLLDAGIEDGFLQELSSAREEYTPEFDLTGVGG